MDHKILTSAVQQIKTANDATLSSRQSTTVIKSSDKEVTLSYAQPPASVSEATQFTDSVVSLCGRNKIDDIGTAMLTRLILQNNIPSSALNHVIEQLYTTPIYCLADVTRLLVGTQPKIRLYNRNEVYTLSGQFPSPDYPLVLLPNNTQAMVSLLDAQTYSLPIVKDYREYAP